MLEYQLFGFQVELDETATRDWYAQADAWDCMCSHCRNFLALAQKQALPAPILEILEHLGIPPEKATYVCEIYPTETGHYYNFSYRLAGRILSGSKRAALPQDWGSGQCCHEIFPYGAPAFPVPHFDLDFFAALPWILDEPDG